MAQLPAVHAVRDVLDQVAGRLARAEVLTAACWTALAGAAAWGLVPLLFGWWDAPTAFRVGGLVALLAGPLVVAALAVLPKVLRRRSPAQVALLVEDRLGGLQNRLINVLQLADDPTYDPAFRVRAVIEAGGVVADVDLDRAADWPALRRAGLFAGSTLLVAVGLVFALQRTWTNGLAALFSPTQPVVRVGAIPIHAVTPGDAAVLLGEPLSIQAELDNPAGRAVTPVLTLEPLDGQAGRVQRLDMLPFGPGRQQFRYTLDAVTEPFRYRVEAGGSRSATYRVTIREKVRVTGLTLRVTPPAYTLAKPTATDGLNGALDVPLGSQVTVAAQVSAPVSSALLLLNGQSVAMSGRDNGVRWEASFPVTQDGQYALAFLDGQGRMLERLPAAGHTAATAAGPGPATQPAVGFFPIVARPDHPPVLKFTQPGQDVAVGVGATVALRVLASDDYHLTALRLLWAKADGEPGQVLAAAPNLAGQARREATLEHAWKLDPQAFPDGSTAVFWAEAVDDRALEAVLPGAGPQSVRSPILKLTVRDEAKLLAARKDLLDALRKELAALLTAQIKAKADTVEALAMSDLPQRATLQEGIVAQQVGIQAAADKLGRTFAFEPQMADLQKAVQILATGELPRAVEQARTMSQSRASARVEAGKQLRTTQDRVIDLLQTLLGLVPQVVDGKLTDPLSKLGADLPADQAEKLKALRDDLNKFIDDQKRVISALAPLAKKPVDDYTDQDKLKLEELAQMEDQWDKFLQEKISDFSKMPEQDFANATLAAELQEIREDVVMAKNALEKKSTEIAVPSAQAGGELAEEIVTNLEKWLPNVPDREKWQMEDPTSGQLNLPMAELPKELEDIVGDLLEQEEDLFEEMQDTTAKAADSMDKGAGWDAMDGPIANMTAKGVTGNQLPNNSEMQGRSGEGRSGKSTGEMVEESAEGKGGRKTPTRLSPDPFQAGQVKDSGKDSPGGATGGGKVSGVTGDGLEGPTAPDLQKDLQRLKERQAQIRNQAEKTAAKFGVGSYEHFKLREAVRLMSQVEQDLAEYRYRNALRKKDVVLNSLATARTMTTAELHVQQDTSPTVSEEVRKDISDAMQGPRPAGFEDEVSAYYKALSESE